MPLLDELSRIHAAVHDLTRNPELGYTGTPTKTDPHDDRPINNLTDLQLELENRLSNPEDWSRSMDKLYAELTSEKTLSKEALTRKLLSLCPLTPNQARSVTQMLSGGSSNGNTPEQHGRRNNKTLFLSPDTTTASSTTIVVPPAVPRRGGGGTTIVVEALRRERVADVVHEVRVLPLVPQNNPGGW